MSESEGSHAATEATEETQRTPVSRDVVRIDEGGLSRWIPLAALLVAVVAVALSIWALANKSSVDSPATANLPGDPKTRVCTAFNLVTQAVQVNTNLNLGPDPVALEAVAGNARLALVGGGQYLLSRLDAATPPELADSVRSFANDLQDVGMNFLVGRVNTDPEQAKRMTQAELTRKQITDLCK
jgi:hypothetical protein